jgi:hypothetical protein
VFLVRRSGFFLFLPEEVEVNRQPLGTVRVPVISLARDGDGFVTSVRAAALGRNRELAIRSPLTALHLSPSEVTAGFGDSDQEVISEVSQHGAYREIDLDLTGAEVDDGSQTLIEVTVQATVSGREVLEKAHIPLRVASLPRVPGWYGGDGHVHTVWSPDVILLPIASRVRHARDNGFGFIIITDHEDGIGRKWGSPGGYCEQCLDAEKEYGLPVLPGVEIAVHGGGHCLAYAMQANAPSVPSNRGFDARRLLWQIRGHNRPHSYGMAAHPFAKREKWGDWSVKDLAGIELINRGRKAMRETIAQWFLMLNQGLAKTLRTREFVVGLANSDCHNMQEPGGKGFIWIHPQTPADRTAAATARSASLPDPATPRRPPLTRAMVWETIRKGRVVGSGSKDLGFFTLNGTGVGGIVRSYPGSTLSFIFEHHASPGRRCKRISLFSGNGRETVLTPERHGRPVDLRLRCPRKSTFYVARFDFAGARRSQESEVWTNPVFVQPAGL